MNKMDLEEISLIGISLRRQTTNENGQSNIDCGNLWQEFERGNYAGKIPGKLDEKLLAVYFQYAGDHSKPFSYFIGCKVETGTEVPQGLESLIIPKATYQKIEAKGKIPDCVLNRWKEIWSSDIPRTYQTDFEVYDERSKDRSNAVVEIFLSIKQ